MTPAAEEKYRNLLKEVKAVRLSDEFVSEDPNVRKQAEEKLAAVHHEMEACKGDLTIEDRIEARIREGDKDKHPEDL
jgi:hypothetical protein